MWTREGWLHLAVVLHPRLRLDLPARRSISRRVVGRATGERAHEELALTALQRAIAIRRPPPGLVHHADRGSQCCSLARRSELRRHGIRASMSGKGQPPRSSEGRAFAESFFKTLKTETIWRAAFQSRRQATTAIRRHVNGSCNPVRSHPTLDSINSIAFERRAAQ